VGHVTHVGVASSSCMASGLRHVLGPSTTISVLGWYTATREVRDSTGDSHCAGQGCESNLRRPAASRMLQNLCCPFQQAVRLSINSTSGNRTPGSRFYSDLLDTLVDFVCIHQLILKRRSKRKAARLTCGSFQLTHLSHDDHAVQLIEPWRPKRGQNVITALTTLPQG